MIKLKNIIKIFNRGTPDEKLAVNDISLHIPEGEFVTVIGSNGAGKTTVLNLTAGTLKPDEGDIHIGDSRVTKLPEHKRAKYIGRIFQNPLLGTAATMTIEENMAMADLRGKPRGLKWGVSKSRRSYYREILSMLDLGLENRLKDPVSLLSGGQRQSLTLLMATLAVPRLLLLDEHTAALDPKTAGKVIELTEKIVREKNLTTIMVTHNMQQAIRYGDRMIMLHEGKIRFDISGDDKRALSVSEVVRRFGADLKDETLLTG